MIDSKTIFLIISVIIGIPMMIMTIWALISQISMAFSQKTMAKQLINISDKVEKLSSIGNTAQDAINTTQSKKLTELEIAQNARITQLENQLLHLNATLAELKTDIRNK